MVVAASNSYNTRFCVYLDTPKFYFYRENIIEKEYFIISLLHGIMVFKILDSIRNQYCSITTQPVYSLTLVEIEFLCS